MALSLEDIKQKMYNCSERISDNICANILGDRATFKRLIDCIYNYKYVKQHFTDTIMIAWRVMTHPSIYVSNKCYVPVTENIGRFHVRAVKNYNSDPSEYELDNFLYQYIKEKFGFDYTEKYIDSCKTLTNFEL